MFVSSRMTWEGMTWAWRGETRSEPELEGDLGRLGGLRTGVWVLVLFSPFWGHGGRWRGLCCGKLEQTYMASRLNIDSDRAPRASVLSKLSARPSIDSSPHRRPAAGSQICKTRTSHLSHRRAFAGFVNTGWLSTQGSKPTYRMVGHPWNTNESFPTPRRRCLSVYIHILLF